MPLNPSLRVMVADDQLLVRAGIVSLLSQIDGVSPAGAVSDGQQALDACESAPPDVLLLDLQMPGPDGVAITRALHDRQPEVKVLILSASTEAQVARNALAAGARGYVSKDFVMDELAMALKAVTAGQIYLSPSVATAVMLPALADPVALTPRQQDVLRGIARGLTNKEIARDMGVSLKTVAYHRAELIQRLDLHDVASLTRYALAQGLHV
jgi:DNA-binding NarL/FixJ family response regulator